MARKRICNCKGKGKGKGKGKETSNQSKKKIKAGIKAGYVMLISVNTWSRTQSEATMKPSCRDNLSIFWLFYSRERLIYDYVRTRNYY